MHDPWNPSPDDIRKWAYTPGAAEPCQDWDLALSWAQHEQVLLECVADDNCPHRRFLLGVLYLMVGDAVRSGFRTAARPVIEGFVARADEFRHDDLRLWQQRSRQLLKSPESFDYQLWCGGGFAHGAIT